MSDPDNLAPPILEPLMVQSKKETDQYSLSIDQETNSIRLVGAHQIADDHSSSRPSSNFTIPLNLTSSANVRNRGTTDFTLSIKFKLSAANQEQKDLWVNFLTSLGILKAQEDGESNESLPKDKSTKQKRMIARRKTVASESTDEKQKVRSSSDSTTAIVESSDSTRTTLKRKRITIDSTGSSGNSSPPTSPTRAQNSPSSSPLQSPTVRRSLPIYAETEDLVFSTPTAEPSPIEGEAICENPHDPEMMLEPEPIGLFPRLIRVHGARNNIHFSWVPRLASSLNKNDCFILEDGTSPGTMFLWKGKSANMFVKSECTDITNAINLSHYGGKAKVQVIEQGLESPSFWDLLNGKGDVAESDTTGIVNIEKIIELSKITASNMLPEDTPIRFGYKIAEEGRLNFNRSKVNESSSTSSSSPSFIAIDTGFEIVLCLSDAIEPSSQEEQSIVLALRKYKNEKSRPLEIRININRTGIKYPLIAHFFK